MKKLTCTTCGSTNVFWFEEYVSEKRFMLKKNGKPCKNPFAIIKNTGDGACNYQCAKCGAIGDGTGDSGMFEIREVIE